MDYEKAWKELMEGIEHYEYNTHADIWYAMKDLERKYKQKCLCIKSLDKRLIKGEKYKIIQEPHKICVKGEGDYVVFLDDDEFKEYFM